MARPYKLIHSYTLHHVLPCENLIGNLVKITVLCKKLETTRYLTKI